MSKLIQGTAGGLAYVETGPADGAAESVLVLIHGFPLDHSMWSAQLEGLAGFCRVVAPDLRGFGGSVEALDRDVLTMDSHADDLIALLDDLGVSQPAAFAGLSMGGYIAWSLWRRHRERVAALALLNTKAAADTDAARSMREASAEHALEQGVGSLVEGMLPKLLSDDVRAARPELVDNLRRQMLSTPGRSFAAAQRGMAQRQDATDLLPTIDAPCLVVAGAGDSIAPPEEMQAFAAAIPNASCIVVDGAAHLAPLEQPEIVNAAMRTWLVA